MPFISISFSKFCSIFIYSTLETKILQKPAIIINLMILYLLLCAYNKKCEKIFTFTYEEVCAQMPSGLHQLELDIPINHAWGFVKDMNNWAPLVPGYTGHTQLSRSEERRVGKECRCQ